ncbi:hypothetical protein PoB_001213400 [Plakobranchus ocellatus]|uniref:Uncharacterized protein n=1 Tax=Plakobranchus ocellatus TaxID=259542 RepID=A0AAV3YUN4_9GAST|nr:hypothetical protein PoB_001213400 [Plakobranchus ocellatus]
MVASESALRSVGILLSRVRALPPAPAPYVESESLRSPFCGLATCTNLLQRPNIRKPMLGYGGTARQLACNIGLDKLAAYRVAPRHFSSKMSARLEDVPVIVTLNSGVIMHFSMN